MWCRLRCRDDGGGGIGHLETALMSSHGGVLGAAFRGAFGVFEGVSGSGDGKLVDSETNELFERGYGS